MEKYPSRIEGLTKDILFFRHAEISTQKILKEKINYERK